MNRDTIHLWCQVAENLFGLGQGTEHGWSNCIELDKVLGVTEYRDFYPRAYSLDTIMDPDLVRLLEKLTGPHAKTILRAYKIQRGISDE